jgi:hypothetical protein
MNKKIGCLFVCLFVCLCCSCLLQTPRLAESPMCGLLRTMIFHHDDCRDVHVFDRTLALSSLATVIVINVIFIIHHLLRPTLFEMRSGFIITAPHVAAECIGAMLLPPRECRPSSKQCENGVRYPSIITVILSFFLVCALLCAGCEVTWERYHRFEFLKMSGWQTDSKRNRHDKCIYHKCLYYHYCRLRFSLS